ncbi:MAG TPA: SAM-dependent methyltransferase [Bdellovibrionota bacterium]|jgi:tRNA G46 methylase TrmB
MMQTQTLTSGLKAHPMRHFEPRKVPMPPDFRKLPVDPDRPLDVEIGCGVGFHPLRYARMNPDRQIIAFERTSAKFARFEGRIRNHPELPNLFAIHGDAVAWISHGFAPESVDRYFLLYPNPYPKESQKNQRFHSMPFFSFLRATLKRGGTLTLATNEEFYMREALSEMREQWGLKLVECREIDRNSAPRSHFEKKYLERGDRCWNMVFIRS